MATITGKIGGQMTNEDPSNHNISERPPLSHDESKSSAVMSINASDLEFCRLPPCDYFRQSRLYSERCGTRDQGWPLLITGTPRSATVYATNMLQSHGMQVQNDWGKPKRDGSVSWIFAFEDSNNFGPARTGGKTFRNVLHQVKEVLGSITSMCTEPILTGEKAFLERHAYLSSIYETPECTSRAALEFWVEWHTFLKEMKFPTYQIEKVMPQTIFQYAGLENVYQGQSLKSVASSINARKHRPPFSWQELYTIDPRLATRAWKLAHEYGYSYPNVDFDTLTCLPYVPDCSGGNSSTAQRRCKAGTHPYPREKINNISTKEDINGINGWVDSGCVELKIDNGTFIGLSGLVKLADNEQIQQFLSTGEQKRFGSEEFVSVGKFHNVTISNIGLGDDDSMFGIMQSGLAAMSLCALAAALFMRRRRPGYQGVMVTIAAGDDD